MGERAGTGGLRDGDDAQCGLVVRAGALRAAAAAGAEGESERAAQRERAGGPAEHRGQVLEPLGGVGQVGPPAGGRHPVAELHAAEGEAPGELVRLVGAGVAGGRARLVPAVAGRGYRAPALEPGVELVAVVADALARFGDGFLLAAGGALVDAHPAAGVLAPDAVPAQGLSAVADPADAVGRGTGPGPIALRRSGLDACEHLGQLRGGLGHSGARDEASVQAASARDGLADLPPRVPLEAAERPRGRARVRRAGRASSGGRCTSMSTRWSGP